MMKKTLFTILLTLAAAQGWGATTWYVSVTKGKNRSSYPPAQRASAGKNPARPLKTIKETVSLAKDGSASDYDTILVDAGVYPENITCAKNYLVIMGSYVPGTSFATRDLKNSRTIIQPTSADTTCFETTVSFNKLQGLDFVGGLYGFHSNGGSSSSSETYHHLLYQCVFSNNTYAVQDTDGKYFNANCISCLFTNNVRGVSMVAENGNDSFCYNCTFVGNTDCAIYRTNPTASAAPCHVYNCLFVGNGTAIKLESTGSQDFDLYQNLFWNNGENFSSTYARATEGTAENPLGSFRFRGAPLFLDPKLTDTFELGTGSFGAKTGEDLSTTPPGGDAVTADLYGTAWSGQYDLGCIKSAELSPFASLLADVYASPSGDDTAVGDSTHPVQTLKMALAKVAANGTVHLANGTYTGTAAVLSDGVKIAGESRDGVIVRELETTPYDGTAHQGFALGLFAKDTIVSNITFTTSTVGLFPADPVSLSGKTTVENCVFQNNLYGVIDGGLGSRAGASSANVLSIGHSFFQNNTAHAIAFANCVRAVNCLFSENGLDAINGKITADSPSPVVYHCTFIDNGSFGYRETFDSASSRTVSYVVNSLFYRNGFVLGSGAAIKAGDSVTGTRCCFYGNKNIYAPVVISSYSYYPTLINSVATDPLLDLTEAKYGRIKQGSSCSKAGTDYTVSGVFTHPVDDIAFDTRPNTSTLDIGCYISPETMEELVGHGYSYLTIIGDKGNFGVPNLGYGKTLFKDGTHVSLAITGLETLDDGARGVTISDVKRASYKGYKFTKEGSSAPTHESETDETLEDVAITTNTTWLLRWLPQYVVSVSNNAPNCTVTLGENTTPICTGDWVAITNWINEGDIYELKFNGTDDYKFKSWVGNFPPEGDVRLQEQSIVCNGSYSFYPSYQSIICVTTLEDYGVDLPGRGTAAKPYKTIAYGVAHAQPGDVVRISSGTYAESVTNTTVSELTIEGGYKLEFESGQVKSWTRDLVKSQTVIQPTNTLPCVYLDNVVSNVLRGLVLQKGSAGIVVRGPDKTAASTTFAVRNNRLEQLIVRQNVGAGVLSDKVSDAGVRIVSSLIYENGGDGVYFSSADGAPFYVHNCTVARNTGNGLVVGAGNSSLELRNSLLVDNVKLQLSLYDDPGNPVNLLCGYNGFYTSETNVTTATVDNYPIAGNYFLDPVLNDDFSLKKTSPYIGLAEDLTDYSPYTELEDLYGTSWAGTYTIGAIRSDALPTLVDEVSVAAGEDLQRAILTCAESGTVHVAAGTYYGPITVQRRGIKIVGEGVRKTSIAMPADLAASELRGSYAVQLGADDIELSGFTISNATSGCGVLLGTSHFAKNNRISDCNLVGNKYGVGYNGFGSADKILGQMISYMFDEKFAAHQLSHCRITDNLSHGIAAGWQTAGFLGLTADNCLIARNGAVASDGGVWMSEASRDGLAITNYFYYCTSADNAGYGFYAAGTRSACFQIVNSVITRNPKGIRRSNWDDPTLDATVLAGNGSSADDDTEAPSGRSFDNVLPSCSRVAPTFSAVTGVNAYCPVTTSSAYDLARELVPTDQIAEPVDDLAHSVRGTVHRDAGCRVLPPYGAVAIFF